MYGKIFESMFTGSMVGAGSHVFAVWGYVLANTKPDGYVELNPILLAAIIGETREKVQEAIDVLCEPDPDSRNKDEEGRRLVREGQFYYRVVTYHHYRNLRNDEERREYFRIKKQEQRAREREGLSNGESKTFNGMSKTVQDGSTMSTQSESEAESESNSESESNLKRLILACVREYPKIDPEIVELGVLYCLLQKRDCNKPDDRIQSLRYFEIEINKANDPKTKISKNVRANLLERRRAQLGEVPAGILPEGI